ncbi:MAG: SLBB domain-containing protein [Saprospiraceae bacterium]|nr:SLBB domain-containing protein [Saprospiraceae bacterium]
MIRYFNLRILSIFLFCAFIHGFVSQVNAQQTQNFEKKAKDELEARGVTEDELRTKLLEKGIDVDNLKNMDPNQVIQMQAEIETAIQEIQAEKSHTDSSSSKVKETTTNKEKKSQTNNNTSKKNNSNLDPRSRYLESTKRMSVNDTMPDKNILLDSMPPAAIWGQEIFRNQSLDVYKDADNIKPPDSYVLGVGDQITVTIWGQSQLNEIYEINTDGYITPTRMPRIFLKGATMNRAREILKNYFRKFYRFNPNEFQVSVNYSRTININIFGEVFQAGGYTLPAINTAFNALIATGGPTNLGSVRKIKLIRNGKESNIDIYKFMADPSIQKDYYLENNDIIQVPVAERVVAIEGYINRPMRYELIDGENLNKLIHFAGGLKPDAIKSTIQVTRIQKDKKIVLTVRYADLLEKKTDFELIKGDEILISGIKTKSEDYVFVKGEVRAEVKSQYKEGLKVSELIKNVQFTPQSNLDNAFIKRTNPDQTISLLRINLKDLLAGKINGDKELQPMDELTIFKLSDYTEKGYVSVSGTTRKTGKYFIDPNKDLRVKDVVLLAGGLKPDAWPNAYIFRSKQGNQKDVQVIRVAITKAMADDASDQNILLEPFDSLVFLSEKDFSENLFIDVRGSVKSPGMYKFGDGMQIMDAISMAGGFQYEAATNRVEIFRIIIKENEPTQTVVKRFEVKRDLRYENEGSIVELEPFDIIVIRSQPEFEFQQIVTLGGEVKYPGPYALIKANERLSEIIERAGGLTPEAFEGGASLYRTEENTGYVVMELDQALRKPNSRYDYILKDGDRIEIPKQKDLVKIKGATNARELYPDKFLDSENAITVAYYEGKSAKFYVNHFAAGVSKFGDPKKITVQHANGRIERPRSILFATIYPTVSKGSVINVGAKEQKKIEQLNKEKKDIDWAKVTADVLAQATTIISLILLLDRL